MINTTVTIWSKLFCIGMFVTISMTLFLLCNTSNAVAITSHTASLSASNHPADGLDDYTVAAAPNNRSLNSIYLLLMADTTPPFLSLPASSCLHPSDCCTSCKIAPVGITALEYDLL